MSNREESGNDEQGLFLLTFKIQIKNVILDFSIPLYCSKIPIRTNKKIQNQNVQRMKNKMKK